MTTAGAGLFRARRRPAGWTAGWAREAESLDPFGDVRGRDAYAFGPITSPYLEVGDDLRARTPYSRTVLEELRAVPWSRWDDDLKAWRVPFRSYEELRRRWRKIEEAARRNEPKERKRRREANKNSETRRAARLRSAERRRRRYPLSPEELPPMDRPVATEQYGIVVFTNVSGEFVEPSVPAAFYPHAARADVDDVWGTWRPATLSELITTWPARREPLPEHSRGWWQPTLAELRIARRNARSVERRKQRRDSGGSSERRREHS